MVQKRSQLSEFAQECLEHMPSLLGVARRLTRSPTEAEDLVQDTLLKAIRARDQYQPGTNLKAWLLKIQKNTFINRYHRSHLERGAMSTSFADPIVDGWLSSASISSLRDAESGLMRPQIERQILAAIDELPEDFRMVVVLADVEGFGYREVAETLGCPIGTVMSRLHRARAILKGKLIQHARDLGLVQPEPEIGPRGSADSTGTEPIELRRYLVAGRGREAVKP